MNVPLINEIAAVIRRTDGSNKMTAHELGWAIASDPDTARALAGVPLADLVAFVERTNLDKRMGAGALAELIVAEFNLDTAVRP